MGPFWDGNEVWLITAGGVTFAAFPTTYAVMFSGLYSALMLILFALILRGVSIAFRDQVDDPRWRRLWDTGFSLGSFLPALLLGVAFANLFKGLPIDAEGIYQGTLFTLLNPYGLAGGILFVLLFIVHGALWLAVKSQETGSRGNALGFDRQPQGPVHQEEQQEEHPPGQAVGVDQGEQTTLVDAALRRWAGPGRCWRRPPPAAGPAKSSPG